MRKKIYMKTGTYLYKEHDDKSVYFQNFFGEDGLAARKESLARTKGYITTKTAGNPRHNEEKTRNDSFMPVAPSPTLNGAEMKPAFLSLPTISYAGMRRKI